MDSALVIKEKLIKQNQQALQEFKGHKDIVSLVTERCLFIDNIITHTWLKMGLNHYPITLVAVGGYGRGELHPQSDVDLLFLIHDNVKPTLQHILGQFIAFLWDSGLEIGHSVRTINETITRGKQDITIATNLLEARFIAGQQSLFNQLYQAVRSNDFWLSYDFFMAKREEQKIRHKKSSAFDLEPNIKSCPGGLRDIQTIAWVAIRHFNARKLAELVNVDFLEQDELEELLQCQSFLWQLRFSLHSIVGRDENRLLFDLQPQVAKLMGYQDGTQLAVEQMMKLYYRTVRRVIELTEMLLQLFKKALLSPRKFTKSNTEKSNNLLNQPANKRTKKLLAIYAIDKNYQRRGRFIEALPENLFNHPVEVLNLFLVALSNVNITAIYAPTLRSLRRARRSLLQPLIEYPECRKIFMDILKHERSIFALSLMHKHGILSAYLPSWRAIEGQMQFDLFHAYTVDEHTHRLLLYIEQFATQEHKDAFPLGSQLFSQLPKKGLLVLAAIFHDIAKGRGGDHSILGAKDALVFCKLHGISDHDGRLVAWLVKHHLLMSITAQRRDISDPEEIAKFADIIRDSIHLNYLYCLTVADICATNNQTWNSWKGSLMRELYFSTQRILSSGKEKPIDAKARVREHQAKAKKELINRGIDGLTIDKLWRRFKANYFLRHTPSQIAWHAEAILKLNDKQPLVLISKHNTRGGTELFIYCPDKPQLFATIMAILDNKNVNVHDAIIMSSKDNYALDSFIILEQDGKSVTQLQRIQSIRKALEKAITNDATKSPKFRNISRRIKPFNVPTQVNFLPSTRQNTTTLELIALDKPGLLAKVGDLLYRCQILLIAAKITTIGERVEDFFVLQTFSGKKLNDEQKTQLQHDLIDSIAKPF